VVEQATISPPKEAFMKKISVAAGAATAAIIAASIIGGAAFAQSQHDRGDRHRAFIVNVADVSTATTLQTSQGPKPVPLSPGVFAVYRGSNVLFRAGRDADLGTERIAEDGFTSVEVSGLVGHPRVRDGGVFEQIGGELGPAFEPGSSTEFRIIARPGDRFSLETMFVQSNDWFYGFQRLPLFKNGRPISGDVTNRLRLYDAGTEVDEEPGAGTFQKPNQGPNDVDVGPSEDEPVQLQSETGDGFAVPPAASVIRVTVTPVS
jgi:hypothetical protein